MTSKYNEFLSRLFVVATKGRGLEVLIDRTVDFNNPTLHIEGAGNLDEDLYSHVVAVIKTCGYKILSQKKTKKKLSVKIEVTNECKDNKAG